EVRGTMRPVAVDDEARNRRMDQRAIEQGDHCHRDGERPGVPGDVSQAVDRAEAQALIVFGYAVGGMIADEHEWRPAAGIDGARRGRFALGKSGRRHCLPHLPPTAPAALRRPERALRRQMTVFAVACQRRSRQRQIRAAVAVAHPPRCAVRKSCAESTILSSTSPILSSSRPLKSMPLSTVRMTLIRARRLSLARIVVQGAKSVSLFSSMMSRARV